MGAVLAAQLVIGKIRVQEVIRSDGRVSSTIVWPTGEVYEEPDGYLRTCTAGTSRTYAYMLVDHLRWLEAEALSIKTVTFADVEGIWAPSALSSPGRSGHRGDRERGRMGRVRWGRRGGPQGLLRPPRQAGYQPVAEQGTGS